MHNNNKGRVTKIKWSFLLLGLTIFYHEAFAELFPSNYYSMSPEQRCSDLQAGIKSSVQMAEREHCGNHLDQWSEWVKSVSAQAKYQWCLKQPSTTLDQLIEQLDVDFFSGTEPQYTPQKFSEANLCVGSIHYYNLVKREAGEASVPWVSDEKKSPVKAQSFQSIPSGLVHFIRQVEVQGRFRRNNPLRRLYPERKGCYFSGAMVQLSPDSPKQQWVVAPSYDCWDIIAFSKKGQYWPQRFWIIEQSSDGQFHLLLDEDGGDFVVKKTQTAGYYDLSLTTDSGATLSAGKHLDPYSKAIYQKLLWDNDVVGTYYVYQRFHYSPNTQQYESPDKGVLFSPMK